MKPTLDLAALMAAGIKTGERVMTTVMREAGGQRKCECRMNSPHLCRSKIPRL